MKHYTFSFIGCEKGEIGAHYKIKATTIAENEEDAKLKLYDKYDHITQCKLIKTKNIDNRILQMVENWEIEKRAFSNLKNDDSIFFEIIGVKMCSIGITSQTGNDLLYYDVNIYGCDTNAIRKIKI